MNAGRFLSCWEQKGICSKEKLEQAAANYEFDFDFLLDLPYGDKNRLEGYLFPDTYEFYMGDEPENVLKKFLRNYNNKFTEDMEADIAALNQTLAAHMRDSGFTEEEIQAGMMDEHKIVIVASLIEKETAGILTASLFARLSTTVVQQAVSSFCRLMRPFSTSWKSAKRS